MKRADRVLLKVVAVASVAVVGVAVSQQGADPEDPPDEAAEVYAKPPDCGPLPARDGPKSYHDAYLEDVIERNRRKGLCPEVADEAPAVPAEEPEAPTPLRPTLVSDDGDVWAYGSVEVAAAYEMAFDQIAELRAAEPTLFGGDRARAKREVDRAAFALMAAPGRPALRRRRSGAHDGPPPRRRLLRRPGLPRPRVRGDARRRRRLPGGRPRVRRLRISPPLTPFLR